MVQGCKGICVRAIFEPRSINGKMVYSMKEYRKCRVCAISIKWNKLNCPCCGGATSTRKSIKKARTDVKRY